MAVPTARRSPTAPTSARSRRRAPATVAVAVAALATTALLGGCGFETRQQAAAVVNGQVISESDVRETADQLKAAKLTTKEEIVVTGLIAAPLLTQAQAGAGGFAPDEAYASTIAQISNPTEATKAFVYTAVMLQNQKLSPAVESKYAAAVKKADVSVNPKFGAFRSGQAPVFFQLGAASPNWIKPNTAQPAATAPVAP